jgi:hypothetical protein
MARDWDLLVRRADDIPFSRNHLQIQEEHRSSIPKEAQQRTGATTLE